MEAILWIAAYAVGVIVGALTALGACHAHALFDTRHDRRREAVELAAFATDARFLDRHAPGWETGDCALRKVWAAQRAEREADRLQDAIEDALRTVRVELIDEHAPGWRTGDANLRQIARAERAARREHRQRLWMLEVAL